MIEGLNPPAIVRPAEIETEVENTKSAKEWDEQAQSSDRRKSVSMLEHAEALYFLDKFGGYKELGFTTINEYVFENFSKSSQTTEKLIKVYDKYVLELGCDQEDLADVGWGKLSQMQSYVDADNVEGTLADMKNMTQKEISDKIKLSKGIEPNETETSDDTRKLILKGPSDMMDVVQVGLEMAKAIYAKEVDKEPKDIPDLKALELIIATFCVSIDEDLEMEDNLQKSLGILERAYGVDITFEKVRAATENKTETEAE